MIAISCRRLILCGITAILSIAVIGLIPYGIFASAIAKKNRLVESSSTDDVFVTGRNYFRVLHNNNECLVRAGRLVVLPQGELGLRTLDGEVPFSPQVVIPDDSESFAVDNLGVVRIKQPGVESLIIIGQLDCGRLHAGRMVDVSIGSVITPEVAAQEVAFGPEQSAFVVSGWAIETD